jgi:hypothetical protein
VKAIAILASNTKIIRKVDFYVGRKQKTPEKES